MVNDTTGPWTPKDVIRVTYTPGPQDFPAWRRALRKSHAIATTRANARVRTSWQYFVQCNAVGLLPAFAIFFALVYGRETVADEAYVVLRTVSVPAQVTPLLGFLIVAGTSLVTSIAIARLQLVLRLLVRRLFADRIGTEIVATISADGFGWSEAHRTVDCSWYSSRDRVEVSGDHLIVANDIAFLVIPTRALPIPLEEAYRKVAGWAGIAATPG